MSLPVLPPPLLAFEAGSATAAAALAQVDAAVARFTQERSAGRILPNAIEAIRVELTYNSNAIEGNTLTLRETQLVIEGCAPAGGKPLREIYEARNHDLALRMIEAWAAARPRGTAPTERDMLDIHARVLADIDTGAAGRLRSERVLIAGTGFVPPGSHRFGALLPALVGLAGRGGVHPVLQAAELHYNTVAVHPFRDGNGRTARLLMNYHLLSHGYPHAIIEATQRGEYLAALDDADSGRWERFALFVVRSLAATIGRLLAE